MVCKIRKLIKQNMQFHTPTDRDGFLFGLLQEQFDVAYGVRIIWYMVNLQTPNVSTQTWVKDYWSPLSDRIHHII